MRPVAYIRSDFSSKFGVPRQSGLVDDLEAAVIFTPEFRDPSAVRGLEGFSHIWLIWAFHQALRDTWSGTPILDVKPYLLYGDCHPDAVSGFAAVPAQETLQVVIPPELCARVPEARRRALRGVLAQDPRPHYQNDPGRIYGFSFAGMEIRFSVDGGTLTVVEILP